MKTKNTADDNEDLVLQGIQLAVQNMKEDKNDEFHIFGLFVASEPKRLATDSDRQKLKRIIQRSIMDFNDMVC